MPTRPTPESIEAHQVALVAAATALDLDWEGDRPILKSLNTWRRFSNELQDENSTADNRKCLDDEQIYFQAFVLEHCLGGVHTANAELALVLFDAWDYYLRNLPSSHGVHFDYDTWLHRRTRYAQAWNDASDRRTENPDMVKNPFFPIAMCLIEDICDIGPDPLTVGPITLESTAKAVSFTKAFEKCIVDCE